MRSLGRFLIASALITVSSTASAATYLVKATGNVGRIATVQNDVVNLNPDLTGSLTKVGDTISYSFVFDTAGAVPASLFDADPAINIYDIGIRSMILTMGGYTYVPSVGVGGSLQLWNDRVLSPTLTVDSQSFSLFDYPVSGKSVYPFAIGSGRVSESISLDLFDFNHVARGSDLISEIVDPSKFGSKLFSYGLLSSDASLFYHAVGDNMAISITALPEPTTWGMMIMGFGVVGIGLRRRSVSYGAKSLV